MNAEYENMPPRFASLFLEMNFDSKQMNFVKTKQNKLTPSN